MRRGKSVKNRIQVVLFPPQCHHETKQLSGTIILGFLMGDVLNIYSFFPPINTLLHAHLVVHIHTF